MSLKNFKYSLIDLNNPIYSDEILVNNCYQLWKDVYLPIHEAAKENLLADSFYKAKLLSAVHDSDKNPVVFCLHDVLDMRLTDIDCISYFQGVDSSFLKRLRAEKHVILSVEWVTVRPQDRARFSKLQYYDLIVALSNRVLKSFSFTGIIGFTRMDLQVDRMVSKFGHKPYGTVSRHEIDCQIMMITPAELKSHPFKIVEQTADQLWSHRSIRSGYIQHKDVSHERASSPDYSGAEASVSIL